MNWDDHLLAVLDDLEMQAEGLHLAEREDDVAALALAGYAEVDLASRWHAAPGRAVRLRLVDASELRGTVRRVGRGWVLLDAPSGSAVVLTAGIAAASGLPPAAVGDAARPRVAGLGVGTALRALAEDRGRCVLRCRGAGRWEGTVTRAGRDFVEIDAAGMPVVLPFSALLVVQEVR